MRARRPSTRAESTRCATRTTRATRARRARAARVARATGRRDDEDEDEDEGRGRGDGTRVTREEIERAANARGLTLETKFYGPVFKMEARRMRTGRGEEGEADVVATHDGFVAPPPFGILHMYCMRVYNSKVSERERGKMRSTFGIAILLGTMSLLEGAEAGCKKCELLAIDDGNGYAEKLVRYYGRLGFETVRVVGENGLRDIPDLLVWGGVGTRMNGDVDALLAKWGGVIRKQLSRD
jgi:hypothetical protein